MRIVKRLPTMLQQTLLYGAGIAIMKGVSLLMLPLLTRYLEPADYGRLEVLTSLAAITSVVVGFGLTDALFRFSSEEPNAEGRKQVAADALGLTSWFTIIAVICAVVLAPILMTWLPGELSNHEIRLILLTIALEGIIAIPLSWLRLNDKASDFFLISTGKALLQALLTFYLLQHGRGVSGVVEAGFIAALSEALLLFVIQIRATGINFSGQRFKEMVIYGLPLVGSGLVLFFVNGIDRWVLADQVGIAEMAQYAIAAKFALATALLIQPYTMWWMPRRFIVVKEMDGKKRAAHYAFMGVTLIIIIGFVVSNSAPLVMTWLLPASYEQAQSYIVALVLIFMVRESADFLNLGCFVGEKTHAQLLVNISAALIACAGLMLLVPPYGVNGALAALLLAQSSRLCFFIWLSQRTVLLPYAYKKMMVFLFGAISVNALGLQIINPLFQASYLIFGSLSLVFLAMHLMLLPNVVEDLANRFSTLKVS